MICFSNVRFRVHHRIVVPNKVLSVFSHLTTNHRLLCLLLYTHNRRRLGGVATLRHVPVLALITRFFVLYKQ
ncbi:hypothetical protein TcasGA2_TC033470 [Tribolium castaneum]|uniref:Uncharacterized protein n=1 Tax=Tribolium castaneum TaxID=7070 RepID=A0A139WGC3_TRICA|nr:hypothetical protein TcasGA2_TC033470 [Tribolium castaneum]